MTSCAVTTALHNLQQTKFCGAVYKVTVVYKQNKKCRESWYIDLS